MVLEDTASHIMTSFRYQICFAFDVKWKRRKEKRTLPYCSPLLSRFYVFVSNDSKLSESHLSPVGYLDVFRVKRILPSEIVKETGWPPCYSM